jgi:predicted RNA-binding Zn ribbon-like protein
MAPTPVTIPGALRPVLDFANTLDIETGEDAFGAGPSALGMWLAESALAPRGIAPEAGHLRLALDLRTGLRALMLANNGGTPSADELAAAAAALARLPLVAAVDPADPLLPVSADPVTAGLSRIAAGYASAVASGLWPRLRRCPAEDCQWAFWDSSPAGSRRWCTMRVCGNRAKARAYSSRRRGA